MKWTQIGKRKNFKIIETTKRENELEKEKEKDV
jgi:hypothetical protein